MDTDLKCNRLTCRRALTDKAVVTTCSHIFCVDCANELFNSARLCPACETSLSEPDDVVVCSLHPSNDYKTSVMSGLSPSTILEICSRAISFWQYQIHQENSFQQAVVRNANDKNMQLQKQLENVVREANGEINILSNKVSQLERDLELERRKVRDLQDASRERDKEYQKLRVQYDKIKRKALLAPNPNAADGPRGFGGPLNTVIDRQAQDEPQNKTRPFATNLGNSVNLGNIVGGMEANGIQRTPIVNRTMGGPIFPQSNNGWSHQQSHQGQGQGQIQARNKSQRQPFGQQDRSYRSGSDRSESANEVENLLTGVNNQTSRPINTHGGWAQAAPLRTRSKVFASAPSVTKRTSMGFRPAGGTGGSR